MRVMGSDTPSPFPHRGRGERRSLRDPPLGAAAASRKLKSKMNCSLFNCSSAFTFCTDRYFPDTRLWRRLPAVCDSGYKSP